MVCARGTRHLALALNDCPVLARSGARESSMGCVQRVRVLDTEGGEKEGLD